MPICRGVRMLRAVVLLLDWTRAVGTLDAKRKTYLSYTWNGVIPKTAMAQVISTIITIPTMTDMLPPLTADSIWPPMIQLMTA